MARIGDDLHAGGPAQGTGPKILSADHGQVTVPSDAFIAHGDLIRDGQDLILKADGQSLVIKGYFSADSHPAIHSPSGATLTPDLVQSFAHYEGPVQYAADAKANDASPVGVVKEVHGHATIHHTDGTTETIIVGSAVHEGDIIETDGAGAVNIMFRDNSSFAVSHNAKLAIDEYVFDPHSDAGASNFSMLRGMFVYTSGLIGHQDPDDVHIHTPAGSIGIRGTVIAGNVDTGQVTVVEGAIVLTSNTGEETTLSTQYETAQFDNSTGHITNEGAVSGSALSTDYSSLSDVAPAFFTGLGGTGPTTPDTTAPNGSTTAPDTTTPATSPTDGGHTDILSPGGTTTTADTGSVDTGATSAATSGSQTISTETADAGTTDTGASTSMDTTSIFDTGGSTTGDTFSGDSGTFSTSGNSNFIDTSSNSTSSGATAPGVGTTTADTTVAALIDSSGSSTSPASSPTPPPPAGTTFADQLPVASGDVVGPTDQNTMIAMGTFSVLTNDTDPDAGDTLSVAAGSFAGNNGGVFTLDSAGHVAFDPGTAFISLGSGAFLTTSYNYVLMDSKGGQSTGQVSITVTGLNDAPVAVNDTNLTNAALNVGENALITTGVNVLSNDHDPDTGDSWGISAVNGLAGNIGAALPATSGLGTFTIDAAGNLTYDPGTSYLSLKAGQSATATMDYTIQDAAGLNSTATVTVTIHGIDTPPTLLNHFLTVGQGAAVGLVSGNLLVTDPDTLDSGLTYKITSGPAHGTLLLNSTVLGVNDTFTQQDITSGNLKYINDGSTNLTDSIGFSFKDATTTTGGSTLNITVNPVPALDLTVIGGAQGFTITDNTNEVFGSSISGGHDLNGDGFDDLLFVKANSGGVADYFDLNGQSGPIGNIAVGFAPLPGQAAGFTTASSTSGMTIASIGNFGTVAGEEFIIGAPVHDGGSTNSGEALILDSTGTVVETITGLLSPLNFGKAVAGVGDVNGDGYDDVLIGAPLGVLGINRGSLYLVYGGQGAIVDLGTVSLGEGIRVDGTTNGWKLGTDVSAAGDFNNDGYADFMTSVPGAGTVEVYLGGSVPNVGSPITINVAGANADIPIMNLSDVSGDGIGDIGVISHAANGGTGQLTVYYGGVHAAGSTASADLTLNAAPGTILVTAGSVGDFNGDGISDIGVITRNVANTQADIYVLFGGTGLGGTIDTNALSNTHVAFHMTYNLTNILGGGDNLTITSAGDLNGDGFSDLVIGTPTLDTNTDLTADGGAIVVYGTISGFSPVVTDNSPADASPTPNTVAASGNNQDLVSGSSNDTLNDNNHTGISFSAGAGGDAINITNGSFHTIDGGAGTDTLCLQGLNSSLDFTGLNAEAIKRVEAIDMQGPGQSLTLNMHNIFNMMETSDTASLTITSSGSLTNTVTIDNLTGSSGTPSGAGADTALKTLLGAGSVTPNGTSTYDFHFGSHTLSIAQNLVDGGHVTVL